jgi:hypothetical protein
VLNLKFATRLDHEPGKLQIQESTLESTFSSVAYDSEIRRVFYDLALHRYEASFGIATLGAAGKYGAIAASAAIQPLRADPNFTFR